MDDLPVRPTSTESSSSGAPWDVAADTDGFGRVQKRLDIVPDDTFLVPAPATLAPLSALSEILAAVVREGGVGAILGGRAPTNVLFGLYTRAGHYSDLPAAVLIYEKIPFQPSRPMSDDPRTPKSSGLGTAFVVVRDSDRSVIGLTESGS